MKSERWKQIDELLSAALKLDSEKRAAFLNEVCAGDEALRKEVETLLASDERAHSSFIESPASQLAAELVIDHKNRLSPGDSIGPYKILSLLGAGGMGEVYRARDTRLDRDVAIKVLPEHLAAEPQSLSRFQREVKALAALSHSNILTIHDFGVDHGIPYAVMELLKGQTLREKLSASKLSTSEALGAAISIADGMAAAHSAGVIHRDLKPENIFLTSDGGVKILDFGLARREMLSSTPDQTSMETVSRTATGLVLGTIPYMSPEQVRGDPVDARSDIFSFGSVLYEMLTGTRAFARRTQAETIAAILNETPDQLSEAERKFPVELNQVVQHCLEKNPDQRFQSARDLTFALRSASSGMDIGLQHVVPQQIPRKRSFSLAMVALLILIAIASSLYLLKGRGKPIHSLAILPFTNGSKDPDAEYLSDGISESITNSLSNLPKLRVMAHDTVFTYKGKQVDPRKVGHDLNVEAVVTGRVMQQGDTLVIRAALVNVADGTELWGEQYNRKLADVLGIQEEISSEISKKLQLKLTGEEEKSVTKHYTSNSQAYQLYLRGRYYWYKETPEGYDKSIQYYEQALQKDPNYALAYAGLANTYDAMAYEGSVPPKEGFEKARAAVTKALEMDENLAEAYVALGALNMGYDWNQEAAVKAYQRAIALNPNETTARRYYSTYLMREGRKDEAIAEMKRVLQVDPLSLEANKSLGATLFWAKQYDQAIEQLRKTAELDPNYAPAHDLLTDVYSRKGMYKEAIEEQQNYLTLIGDAEGAKTLKDDYELYGYLQARRLQFQRVLDFYKEAAREQYVSPITFASIYALLDQKDEALKWLEKAYEERSPWLFAFVPTDPQFDNLRSDPRFKDLMRRIGLPS